MGAISMVMFDLSRTTVEDGTGVQDCLYEAAQSFGVEADKEEITALLGVNKIHLFQYLIERSQGKKITIEAMEKFHNPDTLQLAREIFQKYEELMLDFYSSEIKEMPGATDAFRWLRERGIKIATDTGFHGNITEAIMDGLGWLKQGLIDLSVHVEYIPGQRGRPAPYMIFYAMEKLNIQSVHEVVKVGDTSADMLEGFNAGCKGVVGVLTGHNPIAEWGRRRHTHIIPSVKDFPRLMEDEFM